MDRLSTLLKHFNLHASAFHQGGFCGTTQLGQHSVGHAHLLRSGRLSFKDKRGQRIELTEPTLILAVRPQEHHLLATDADADDLRARDADARKKGVSAVPTFLIAQQYVVSGAQPPEVWGQVITELTAKLNAESA